ncbi:lysozyme inhibitor LprI family protein [Cupriavidus taiwanensis]|uniref:lysozyme inhibitor LprI family protein n=1 Tax=Cupriavidus taiwanensis TaxID=164546 RepID=UPI00253FFFAE|nr:lysozyme inhibitor LprI family protein [Cupriavidus taiwanensis]MDK3021296.1 lysozyme inhibitor LprI family protein [Cupriavidus taiwanensis]
MRVFAYVAVAGLAVAAIPAGAAGNGGLSADYERCMGKAVSTADMLNCAALESRVQEAALNRAYQSLLRRLEPPRTGQLRVAQRVWLEYRQAHCAFVSNPAGGSAARVAGAGCMLDMTAARARELRTFATEAAGR